jgi:hypothetical protein
MSLFLAVGSADAVATKCEQLSLRDAPDTAIEARVDAES